jgi:glycosyltransferase involved in cell wall biosynthesis
VTAILHVISGLGMGGAERNLAQVVDGLQSRGLPQHVVCVGPQGVWADRIRSRHIDVTTLGVESVIDAPLALVHLSSLIRSVKPAVVQGWMYHGDLFATLAHRLAPGRAHRRLIWNLRASNTDLGGYGRIVAFNAKLSSWPDLVVANSKAGLDFHVGHGYRPRQTEIIPNGIDTEKFRPDAGVRSAVRSELGIEPGEVVVIHVARVDPMKDHATFLRAMAWLPELKALLVGLGTEKLSVPPNVKALGLRHDIEKLYTAADFVVSSSAFAEGFSNAIAEGMSAGLIPVATDIGDARAIVGDIGHLVPSRNPDAIVRALKEASMLSPDKQRSKAEQARRRIVESYSLSHNIDRYAGLYA